MNIHPEFLYANGVEVSVSFYDFSLRLRREGTPHGAAEGLAVGKVATNVPQETFQAWSVSMSPQHAKELSRMLQKSVERYESMFGAIPSLPEGVK